ncbi:uncharacterized protein L203_102795 [Cryptococcus depauperatus CBS 7841]|uniref:Poly(A) polymerase n=1 Tax=Cryptococcus depauperatus CBS 7841 TaxID=1295531 RepID=A0AAJ8JSJ3_9TREE
MASNQPITMLGVTPPISTDPPKESDLKASEALLADLVALNQFESDQERRVRERLLSNIAQLVAKFVHDVSIKLGMSEKMATEAGGRIYTSGSYRLGVHGPGADIDTICVCPRHIYKEHFFGEFQDMLRAWPAVTEISAVTSAFVPIMKTVISGVEMDLLFARVNLPEAGDGLDIEKDEILRGVDDASQRGLNGPRVTDMILDLVPDVAAFRTVLRTIRLWAKCRGIYANIIGFPGGVAWALLTARICQLYPTAAPAVIVGKFFPIYYQWKWPMPVILKKIENGPAGMQHAVWNPRVDRRNMQDRMPVITPAYPSMCTTYNITASTYSIIKKEMLRAMQITDDILKNAGNSWMRLFEKIDFFGLYKTYIQVVVSASSQDSLKDWAGMVESKLRILVQDLESLECVVIAHPHVSGVGHIFYCLSEEEQAAASQGELTEELVKRTKEDVKDQEHIELFTKSFFVGLEIEKKSGGGQRVLDLLNPTRRFCTLCQGWDKYDENVMSVILRPTKRSDLPSFVFPNGALPKPKKKGKRANQDSDSGIIAENDQTAKKARADLPPPSNGSQQHIDRVLVANAADTVLAAESAGSIDVNSPKANNIPASSAPAVPSSVN